MCGQGSLRSCCRARRVARSLDYATRPEPADCRSQRTNGLVIEELTWFAKRHSDRNCDTRACVWLAVKVFRWAGCVSRSTRIGSDLTVAAVLAAAR